MSTVQGWYNLYSKMSTGAVTELLECIRRELNAEDAQKPDERQCGIRDHADFRAQANVFERILRERDQAYEPIDWSPPPTGGA